MADTKISALTALTGAGAATGDQLPIADISVSSTKSITLGELLTALKTLGITLNDLSDTTIAGAGTNNVLTYNGSAWVNQAFTAATVTADSTLMVGVGNDVQEVLEELDNGIADHLADTAAAHQATAISVTPTGGLVATDVQAALAELDGDIAAAGIPATLFDATGDILVSSAADTADRLPIGAAYQALTVNGSSALEWATPYQPRTINEQTGTSYTLVLTDMGKEIHCSNAAAFTLTIPANASVAFPVGTEVLVYNKGVGQVTVAITTDTLQKPSLTTTALVGQYSWASLKKLTTTTWAITGDLVAKARVPIGMQVTGSATSSDVVAIGDDQAMYEIPAELNGYDLVSVKASLKTASSSGLPNVTFERKRSGARVDMLSTALTIDANETTSSTAATAAVINTSNDDVATGDQVFVNIDGAGTNAKGLYVTLTFS